MAEGNDLMALLYQARAGNDDALGQLLEKYRAYLRFLARVQINARLRGKVSPSDVVQEAFLYAKRGFSEFRGHGEAELLAWLRRILANNLVRIVRHYSTEKRDVDLERQLRNQLDRSSAAFSVMLQDQTPSPSEQVSRREQSVLLAEVLEDLPNDYREVLALRHVQGLSFPEAARQMGRSLDSVKNLWARAIKRLRDELQATQ